MHKIIIIKLFMLKNGGKIKSHGNYYNIYEKNKRNKSGFHSLESETFSEKDSSSENSLTNSQYIKNYNSADFHDDYAPRYHRCSEVPFYKKNHFKALISNQRIRFIDNNFDLDLM